VELKLKYRAPAPDPGIQNFWLRLRHQTLKDFDSGSRTIWSIKNKKLLDYLNNWLAPEHELKVQAPSQPFKIFRLRLHSPGWKQLFMDMNNIVSTNAIAIVWFVLFFVLTKLPFHFISIVIFSN